MSNYTEGILKVAKSDQEWKHATGTSVGVVVKKYWSRLSELQQVVKHTVKEVSFVIIFSTGLTPINLCLFSCIKIPNICSFQR